MSFLVCLVLAVLFSLGGTALIKQHARGLYLLSTLLALVSIVGTKLEISTFMPSLVEECLWNPLAQSTLATAFFVCVMYAGALKNGSPIRKKLMSIRGELSIIASILTLGHNFSAGQVYFVGLVTDPAALPTHQILAALCSLAMMALMLPLFITSFPAVRKKMSGRRWKKLQRLAYPFYALIYIHVLLLFIPGAREGNQRMISNVMIFTAVFLLYAVLRIRKAMAKRNLPARQLPILAAAALVICVSASMAPDTSAGHTVQLQTLPTEAPERPAPVIPDCSVPPADPKYQNGSFTGKGKGYAGPVFVEITLKNDVITSITVTEHKEDEPYWTHSLVTIDRILTEQKIRVDGVAGATKSCNGIKRAVKDALKQAEI